MALTNNDIKHIAKLSKLSLNEEQIEQYGKELDAIVSYMDILNSVPKERIDALEAHD